MSEWQLLAVLIGITLIVIAGRIRQRSLARHRRPSRPPRRPEDPPSRDRA